MLTSFEDGFGAESNQEVNIAAYIDENCHVLIPFTDMECEDTNERFRKKAIEELRIKEK